LERTSNRVVFQRVAGGPSLVGDWKLRSGKIDDFKFSADLTSLEFTARAGDAVSIAFSYAGMTCEAKMNGRDYPCTGELVQAGSTVSIKQTGPNSLQLIQKVKGRVQTTTNNAVSEDGNSMTAILRFGSNKTIDEAVYDRVR
jgi:hypothetical protein